MKTILCTVIFSLLLTVASLQAQELDSFDLDGYKWKKRVLLIFSPNTFNSDYRNQAKFLKNTNAGTTERDLKIFYALKQSSASFKGTLLPDEAVSDLRSQFGIPTSEFTVLLIGKDGTEKLRSYEALSRKNLFNEIDDLPMRKLEMKEGGD